MKKLRNYFLTGLVVCGPVSITIYLAWALISWIDDRVKPLIPRNYNPETYLPFAIPGMGVIFAFVIITLVGFFTANIVGRNLVRLGERLVGRMPFVRAIYRMLKQIFEAVFSQSGNGFKHVVLVEFPRPGIWSIAFTSGPAREEVAEKLGTADEYINVFLPTAPNPTNGFQFYVARRELIPLDMSIEDAAKLIVSAGLVVPQYATPQPVTMAPPAPDSGGAVHPV